MAHSEYHPYRGLVALTGVGFGGFIVGCISMQPEVAIPGLVVGGGSLLELVTKYADLVDIHSELINDINTGFDNEDDK